MYRYMWEKEETKQSFTDLKQGDLVVTSVQHIQVHNPWETFIIGEEVSADYNRLFQNAAYTHTHIYMYIYMHIYT